MSDAYAIVHIPKSLPIHGVALTSTDRKIEYRKVTVHTQTYESISLVSLKNLGFSSLRGVAQDGYRVIIWSPINFYSYYNVQYYIHLF